MTHATGKLDFTEPYITMFDDITVSALPSGSSYAYAGYPTALADLRRPEEALPEARLLDMAVFASDNATGLDIENGDATIEEAPAWFERQIARGVYRPVLYIAASRHGRAGADDGPCRIHRAAGVPPVDRPLPQPGPRVRAEELRLRSELRPTAPSGPRPRCG